MNELIVWDRSESGIIPEGCIGIVIDSSKVNQKLFLDNAEKLPKSKILLNKWYDNSDYKRITDKFEELNYLLEYYIDEYITNPKKNVTSLDELEKIEDGIIFLSQHNLKLTFGEPDLDNFPFSDQLQPNEEITYTAYRELWFKIFGFRIYKPFSNQLSTWEELEKKYNKVQYDNVGGLPPVYSKDSKFNLCWISLNKNRKDYKILIDWCKSHNKQIAVFVDKGTSKEDFINRLSKLNQYL